MSMNVLFIYTSGRVERSKSNQLGKYYEEEYKKHHPSHNVETINLYEKHLPILTENVLNGRFKDGTDGVFSEEEKAEWKVVKDMSLWFAKFDKVVVSTPMYNFGPPGILKQFFDVVIQQNITINYFTPLLTNMRMHVIVASAGDYTKSSWDSLKPGMNTICKFMTGREAEFIDFVSQGTMSAGVEERAAMHKKTIDKWILEVVV